MYRVLLLCSNNSVLSPIAQAYFRKYAGDTSEVFCSGITKKKLDPIVPSLLKEDGLQVNVGQQHELDELHHIDFDYVLTFDEPSEEASHHMPSHPVKYHYSFKVPTTRDVERRENAYRKLRDDISAAMLDFVNTHLPSSKAG